MKAFKVITYCPSDHSQKLRESIIAVATTPIGKYSGCTFSITGIGSWIPLQGAKPFQGKINNLEIQDEIRIEITCAKNDVEKVIAAIKTIHPYEQPLIEVYSLSIY